MGAIEISKKDWKIFQERLPGWQERYMNRLCQEYVRLLQSEEKASARFWALDERIKKDKSLPGVQLRYRKSETDWHLFRLLRTEAIGMEDLEGFSQEMIDRLKELDRSMSI